MQIVCSANGSIAFVQISSGAPAVAGAAESSRTRATTGSDVDSTAIAFKSLTDRVCRLPDATAANGPLTAPPADTPVFSRSAGRQGHDRHRHILAFKRRRMARAKKTATRRLRWNCLSDGQKRRRQFLIYAPQQWMYVNCVTFQVPIPLKVMNVTPHASINGRRARNSRRLLMARSAMLGAGRKNRPDSSSNAIWRPQAANRQARENAARCRA